MAMTKVATKLDSKGRVVIPQSMRDSIGIKDGDRLLISQDADTGQIIIAPSFEKKLFRLEIILSDKPGALSHAAVALASLGVDLVRTQSRSSKRGDEAVWIVECNPGKNGASAIAVALSKEGAKLKAAKWE